MLLDAGCRYVIIGHSERRHGMGETDAMINRKVRAALTAGLQVILCVGETLEERQADRVEEVFFRQVAAGLSLCWAPARSGEGSFSLTSRSGPSAPGTRPPEQAQQTHALIRNHIRKEAGEKFATDVPILYGGSVKADNARELFSQPDVDGGLIGGASLEVDGFLAIVRAAIATPADHAPQAVSARPRTNPHDAARTTCTTSWLSRISTIRPVGRGRFADRADSCVTRWHDALLNRVCHVRSSSMDKSIQSSGRDGQASRSRERWRR